MRANTIPRSSGASDRAASPGGACNPPSGPSRRNRRSGVASFRGTRPAGGHTGRTPRRARPGPRCGTGRARSGRGAGATALCVNGRCPAAAMGPRGQAIRWRYCPALPRRRRRRGRGRGRARRAHGAAGTGGGRGVRAALIAAGFHRFASRHGRVGHSECHRLTSLVACPQPAPAGRRCGHVARIRRTICGRAVPASRPL